MRDFMELTGEEILHALKEGPEVGRVPKDPVIVDISQWQDPKLIDYDTFASAIDLAIVRIQHGNLGDIQYKTHIKELQKRNVPIHVYAYFMGTDSRDAQREAQDFYDRSHSYHPLMYWVDVESASAANMRASVSAFVDHLRKLTGGRSKIGVYVANHLYKTFNLNVEEFDAVWIPTYGQNDGHYRGSNPNFTCDLHQFTDKGRVAGYGKDIDISRLTFTNGRGLDYFTTALTEPLPSKRPNPVVNYYPVPSYKGSSLVDALASLNVDSSREFRNQIAQKNGMINYIGSVGQNQELLRLLLEGKLKR